MFGIPNPSEYVTSKVPGHESYICSKIVSLFSFVNITDRFGFGFDWVSDSVVLIRIRNSAGGKEDKNKT